MIHDLHTDAPDDATDVARRAQLGDDAMIHDLHIDATDDATDVVRRAQLGDDAS